MMRKISDDKLTEIFGGIEDKNNEKEAYAKYV